MNILILLVAVLACVICQAFFSASEIALVAADDLKVHAERERGDRRAVVLFCSVIRFTPEGIRM